MARVLQCWELGDGYAYIEGFTMGARALKAAGHEVSLAYRDLKHAERIVGSDFELLQAPTPVSGPLVTVRRPMTFADQMINADYGESARMLGRLRAWRGLIERHAPDVLRVLHAPGALLASRGLGIPTLVVGTGFLIPPPVSPLPNLRPWVKDADPKAMQARESRVLGEMNKALGALKAPPLERLCDLYRVDRQEIYAFPEMDEYGKRAGDDVVYMGVYQPDEGAAPVWPAGNGKKVFAYLELFEKLPGVLEALKSSGCSVLVFMARFPAELRDKYKGTNLAFADKPLNMFAAARQCDYAVSHGGHNIASTALLAGKPQLLMPMFLPERIGAQNVVKLGAGLIAPLDGVKFGEIFGQLRQQEVALAAKAAEFAARHKDYSRDTMFKDVQGNIAMLAKKAAAGKAKKAR